jgi:hypothetical protein
MIKQPLTPWEPPSFRTGSVTAPSLQHSALPLWRSSEVRRSHSGHHAWCGHTLVDPPATPWMFWGCRESKKSQEKASNALMNSEFYVALLCFTICLYIFGLHGLCHHVIHAPQYSQMVRWSLVQVKLFSEKPWWKMVPDVANTTINSKMWMKSLRCEIEYGYGLCMVSSLGLPLYHRFFLVGSNKGPKPHKERGVLDVTSKRTWAQRCATGCPMWHCTLILVVGHLAFISCIY